MRDRKNIWPLRFRKAVRAWRLTDHIDQIISNIVALLMSLIVDPDDSLIGIPPFSRDTIEAEWEEALGELRLAPDVGIRSMKDRIARLAAERLRLAIGEDGSFAAKRRTEIDHQLSIYEERLRKYEQMLEPES